MSGREAPSTLRVTLAHGVISRKEEHIPFGCSKVPFSTPPFKALLKRLSNMLSMTLILLLALMYFLRD